MPTVHETAQHHHGGCMQVLPQDVDSQYGIAQSPIGPSPSQSPLAFQPFGSAPSAPLTAYTSALARSASAGGSANLSRLSRSPSGGTPTPTPADPAAVAPEDAVLGGGSWGGEQPAGLTPPSEDGASVGSVTSSTAQTDTLEDDAQAAQPSAQPMLSSSSTEAATMSHPALSPAARQERQQASQVQEASTIMSPLSPDQPPTDAQASAEAAGADAEAACPAGRESQAGPPSKTELQQSKAVLSGEDQAMQASLAAANAAGGEQVKDALPVPSPHLQEDPSLAQADLPTPSHPTLTQASPGQEPPSEPSASQQTAQSSPDALPSTTAMPGLSRDAAAENEATASTAAGMQEQQPKQAGASGDDQSGADADSLASRQGAASGQIADRFRWEGLGSVTRCLLHRHAQDMCSSRKLRKWHA